MNTEIAAKVFESVIPLYGAIILGVIAGKYLRVEGKNLATLMFYLFMPVVFINSAWHTEFSLKILLLPL